MFVNKFRILVAGALLFIALASVAFAHAQIISCTPDIGGTVAAAPDKLTCKTSEAMDPKGSSLAVFDAMGMQVDKKDSAVDLNDPDRVTLSVSLDPTQMKDGVYTVKWTTLSSADGDSADGEFQFAIGASPVKINPTATAAPENTQAAPTTGATTAAREATATTEATTVAPTATATAQAQATAAAPASAPTFAPTAAPTTASATLPATGGATDSSLLILLALFGVLALGIGAFVAVRARR